MSARPFHFLPVLLIAVLGCAAASTDEADAQDVKRCEPVQKFLTQDFGMVAETERDTMDDWRTHKKLPGCKVTAAGGTSTGMSDTAALLYDQLMAAGWTRTPDPADAPAESALRLRLAETDCFFSVYTMATMAIGTETERRVTKAFVPNSQDARYNVFVQCVPAMPASP
jgi:hypothetical protein